MNTVWLVLTALIPYAASLLVLSVPTVPELTALFIERACYFFICLGACHLALWSAENFIRHHHKKWTPASFVSAALLGSCTLFALTMMQISKLHMEQIFFYFLLVILGLATIAVLLQKKGRNTGAIAVLFCYDTAVAYATFGLVNIELNWPILLFVVGLAGQVASCRLARYFVSFNFRLVRFSDSSGRAVGVQAPGRWSSKLYLLALMSAIVATGVLAMIGVLHPVFFAVYAVLPLISRLAEEFRAHLDRPQNIPDFVIRNTRILLFITAIIPAVGLLLT